jgi:hypothetical protein
MASDFLNIDRSKVHANRVVEIADTLIKLRATLQSEYICSTHMFSDTDYTLMEQYFGLEAGKGAEFYVLLGQVTDVLIGTGEVAGAARKIMLDDFSSRIGGQ